MKNLNEMSAVELKVLIQQAQGYLQQAESIIPYEVMQELRAEWESIRNQTEQTKITATIDVKAYFDLRFCWNMNGQDWVHVYDTYDYAIPFYDDEGIDQDMLLKMAPTIAQKKKEMSERGQEFSKKLKATAEKYGVDLTKLVNRL